MPPRVISCPLGVRPAQLSKVSIAPTYLVLESGRAHLEGARGRDGPHGGSSGGGPGGMSVQERVKRTLSSQHQARLEIEATDNGRVPTPNPNH